jgi:hypothetical protein
VEWKSKKMLAHANTLFGMVKDAGAFYQRITKKLSLKTSEVDFANFTPYENSKTRKTLYAEVEFRLAQVLAEVQRHSLR